MSVEQVIEKLKELPPQAEVFHLWDGEPRTAINIVYEAADGTVITADYDQPCYLPIKRPKDGPCLYDSTYWNTPTDPNDD
jgi:hypothetical protein